MKLVKLKDITSKITKGTTPSKSDGGFSSIGVNYIKAESVSYEGRIDESKFAFITEAVHKKLKRSQLQENDILFSMAGAFLGKTGFVMKHHIPANTNQALALIRVKPEIAYPKFIHYYLQQKSVVHFVNNAVSQSAQPNINLQQIGDLDICLLSLAQQQRVVEILDAIDNKITLNRQINQTLEQMAQTLFKSWFVDFDPVVDNALDAGFFEQDLGFSEELLHRVEVRKAVRESDNFKPLSEDIRRLFPNAFEECAEPALGLGGWVPKGWKGQPIKTHCVKIQNGGTPSRSNSDYWDGGNIPWLTSGEVRQSIVTNVENTITDLGLQNSSAKWVSSYSTLVALYGATAGEVSINVDPLTTNQAVCALIPKESYCWFNYLQVRNKTIEMQNQAVGSAQQNISKRLVENLIVISPLPYIVEIFNQRVEPLFLKSIFNQKMAMELTKLRDTLLPKLISGELSLSDIKIDIPEETLI
ncbi:TPA: restriction endonuclease subunit S [Proteus mirabilis]|nr:restriction endonuclease subunit S [Proteus mirabilis]